MISNPRMDEEEAKPNVLEPESLGFARLKGVSNIGQYRQNRYQLLQNTDARPENNVILSR